MFPTWKILGMARNRGFKTSSWCSRTFALHVGKMEWGGQSCGSTTAQSGKLSAWKQITFRNFCLREKYKETLY